jgi:hypothetical protein
MNNEKSEKKKLFGIDFKKSLTTKENLCKRLQNQCFSQVRKRMLKRDMLNHLIPQV